MRTLNLNFVAPIPVGHRVRATFYEHRTSGLAALFSGESKGAVLVDLDTGVEYSPGFLWQSGYEDDEWRYATELDKNIHSTGTLEGTVSACRVVSRRGNANNHRITTQLTVEEHTP